MSKHLSISREEAADRLAILELIEAYAHCADRRDAKGQMALFTPDTHFVVYMDATDPKPSMDLYSREALAPVFADLNKYHATTHFVGQTTIFTLASYRATGEAYCLAHHVTIDGEKRRLMIASLRYNDTFVKTDGVCFLPSGSSMWTGLTSGHCSLNVVERDRLKPRSDLRCPSVDKQLYTGDEAGFSGRQKERGSGDFLGLPDASSFNRDGGRSG